MAIEGIEPDHSQWLAEMYSFLDPTLEVDVYGEKPWALSPTLATYNYLSLHGKDDKPEYTPKIQEDSIGRIRELYSGGESGLGNSTRIR